MASPSPLNPSSVLLPILISLYYFALQPWAILARSAIVLLTFIYTKAMPTRDQDPRPNQKARETLVEVMERTTKRSISIESAPLDRNLAKCNPQSASPLYTKLPKELRDAIFAYACSQSPSERYPYCPNAYYYRPDHTARLTTDTSLLLTCRLVWLEANALPLRQAELAFWFQRGPYDRHPDSGWRANVQNERDRYTRFLKSLAPRNLKTVAHVHLFMQMFQADQLRRTSRMGDFFPRHLVCKGFMPKRFTITIRSTDWWNWERGQPLTLDSQWLQTVLDSPVLGGIDELALELEAEERKGDELIAMIERFRSLEGQPKLVDLTGREPSHVCKFVPCSPPKTMRWTRSSRINDQDHDAYTGVSVLPLRVTTLRWKNRPCDTPQPEPLAAYPEIAQSADKEHRLPGVTTNVLVPRLILRSRAQRERLRHGGWSEGRFPEVADETWSSSVRRAGQWEDVERERFEKMIGDIEAERLEAQWVREGSLLIFSP